MKRKITFTRPVRTTRPAGGAGRSFSADRAPEGSESWQEPWVWMKYFSYHPSIFDRFIGAASDGIGRGDWVNVYDKEGRFFGNGFFNNRARVPLRMLHHGAEPMPETALVDRLERAVALRREFLKLDPVTNAYRVIHSDGDGLGGLVVDRYADVLAVEISTLAMLKRVGAWLPKLHEWLGTKRHVIQVDPTVAELEGMHREDAPDSANVRGVRVIEHGMKMDVDFTEGHKTGFFCDQRDNRRRLRELAEGRKMLDLCCYTGGFSIAAKLGGAEEVTGVDLDEKAIAQARTNANANGARVRWVHSDAFDYARQMQKNGELFDIVVLDPPKFILSRPGFDEGRRKYHDLNGLSVQLVKKGGLFVTCSCSGLIGADEFEALVIGAAHRQGRKLQFIDRTGAGGDHPVMSNCAESRYLKVLWAIVS